MKKNIIIIVLSVLVLGLSCFIVYDKLISKKSSDESVKIDKLEKIEKKDSAYFDEYLSEFNNCSGINVTRNTSNFNDLDIYYFVTNYYNKKALKDNDLDNYTYSVSMTEVNNLIYQYFNKKGEFNYSVQNDSNNLLKDICTVSKDNSNYIFSWKGVGCAQIEYANPAVKYDGANVTVSYDIYDLLHEKTGEAIFHLKYNKGNYNIVKIEESKKN